MQHLVSSEVERFPLNLCTGRPLTESDDTKCCIKTIQPPDDEHVMLETCRGLQWTNCKITLILRRSRMGTVWFYTSTSNKKAARPKLYTESLTRDLKRMYNRLTLVRISINLQAPRLFYIGTGVSLLSRERFLYIYSTNIFHYLIFA